MSLRGAHALKSSFRLCFEVFICLILGNFLGVCPVGEPLTLPWPTPRVSATDLATELARQVATW